MRIFVLLFLLFLSTGCAITPKSPEQLINEKAIFDEENYILYNKIKSIIPAFDTTSVLPENSTEVGKINKVDINFDDKDEIVVFEKKSVISDQKEEVSQIITTLLLKNAQNNLEKSSEIILNGESIRYSNFFDFNKDKTKELVLVIKNKEIYEMYIYSFLENKFEEIYKLNLTSYNQELKSKEIKVSVGDVDDDGFLDIVVLNQNKDNKKVFLNVLDYKEKVKVKDYIELESLSGLNGVYIKIAEVYKNLNGVVIDYPSKINMTYNTQIIAFDDSKLCKVFKDDFLKLQKPYYIEAVDINNDNIIDFPIIKGSVGSNNSSFNVFWYNYNGVFGEFSNINFLSQVYYNYNYSFKFLFPNSLVDKIHIHEEVSTDETMVRFKFINQNGETKDLFSIGILPKGKVEDKTNLTIRESYSIGENTNNYFKLIIDNSDEFKNLNLSVDIIKENFSYIN